MAARRAVAGGGPSRRAGSATEWHGTCRDHLVRAPVRVPEGPEDRGHVGRAVPRAARRCRRDRHPDHATRARATSRGTRTNSACATSRPRCGRRRSDRDALQADVDDRPAPRPALLQPHAGAPRAGAGRRAPLGLALPVLLRPQLVGQVDLAVLLAHPSPRGAPTVRRLGTRARQPADREAGVHDRRQARRGLPRSLRDARRGPRDRDEDRRGSRRRWTCRGRRARCGPKGARTSVGEQADAAIRRRSRGRSTTSASSGPRGFPGSRLPPRRPRSERPRREQGVDRTVLGRHGEARLRRGRARTSTDDSHYTDVPAPEDGAAWSRRDRGAAAARDRAARALRAAAREDGGRGRHGDPRALRGVALEHRRARRAAVRLRVRASATARSRAGGTTGISAR